MSTARAVVSSPVGRIGVEADEVSVVAVHLAVQEPLRAPRTPLLVRAATEIEEFFAGARQAFSLPLARPRGATEFQNRVWDALLRIPFGKAKTYGDVAEELGTSPRAVGGACARNVLPLLIPCHRVVARSGLGGFSGEWETGMAVDVKKVLLEHEARCSTRPICAG